MNTVVIAILSVSALGLICSVLLSVASKVMAVEVDERIAMTRQCLPGANCGACGYSGCNAYAAAVAQNSAPTNLCTPGGNDLAQELSEIMGLDAGEAITKKVAVIHCLGDIDAKIEKMDYVGIPTCASAALHYGGQKACAFGCLGFGDCLTVCPSDAICIEKGLARINHRLCSGCGLCVKTCPKNVISMENDHLKLAVMCNNTEKGSVLKEKCKVGCIGCMKCVKECPADAIAVDDSLASIDYAKCIGCKKCIPICPKSCIVDFTL